MSQGSNLRYHGSIINLQSLSGTSSFTTFDESSKVVNELELYLRKIYNIGCFDCVFTHSHHTYRYDYVANILTAMDERTKKDIQDYWEGAFTCSDEVH